MFTFRAGRQFGEGACVLRGCFRDASILVLGLDSNYMDVCFILVHYAHVSILCTSMHVGIFHSCKTFEMIDQQADR